MNTAEYLLTRAAGDAPVLIDGERTHTYAELRIAVAELAEGLADLRLPAGSPVAVVAPNGFFWIAAYLATLAAGLVALPIPVTLPPEEATGRLRWVGARAAFLGRQQQRRLGPLLAADAPDVAAFGEDTLGGAERPLGFAAVRPDQDALYEFTSGTTGRPRVVRLTHRNIQANTASILGYLDIRADDRMLVVLPFTYVFGASLLHTHLRAGAALVIQQSLAFAQAVVERMETTACTGFAGVPSTFHLLLRSSTFGQRAVPTLRTIQQAGGRLVPTVLEELLAAQPQADVYVMYGQTEATARLSYLPPAEARSRAGSIGRGIPGVELRVVRPDGTEVRPGEIGEVWARGENVSPGYLNDPEASAAKMPGGVLHTGDLATVDADGYVTIVDRTEGFIKTWGHRVAGQDVEAVAMELGDLIAAAAVGVPDEAAGERVELVVAVRPGATTTVDDVLAHCRRRLARHMVPERAHLVEQLPLNQNGKVAAAQVREICLQRAAASA